MKYIAVLLFGFFLAGGMISSCRYNPVVTHPPCDTCNKPCDTCNLNQDSLQRIKDSLAHAFTWIQYSVPGETSITGCWVFGDNDIYVNGTYLYHFDGISFARVQAYDRTHNNVPIVMADDHIFAFSKTDIWITSSGGEALHTTDGEYYDDYRFGSVNACWGTSSNDMFFVGNGGLIYHYDGTKFDTMVSNTTDNLLNIWGTNDNNIWACNTNLGTGKLTLIHYDGSQWLSDPFANSADALSSGIYGVWTTDSATSHIVTVNTGGYVFRKTDKGPWRKDPYIPNKYIDSSLIPILCHGNNADDNFAAGSYAWFGHWNGKTWFRIDSIYQPSIPKNIRSFHQNNNTVCVVGIKNGNSWVAVGTRKQ